VRQHGAPDDGGSGSRARCRRPRAGSNCSSGWLRAPAFLCSFLLVVQDVGSLCLGHARGTARRTASAGVSACGSECSGGRSRWSVAAVQATTRHVRTIPNDRPISVAGQMRAQAPTSARGFHQRVLPIRSPSPTKPLADDRAPTRLAEGLSRCGPRLAQPRSHQCRRHKPQCQPERSLVVTVPQEDRRAGV
jgi:hypothetical protein